MMRTIKVLLEYVMSIAKISCIFLMALLLPRLFLHYSYVDTAAKAHPLSHVSFKLGLENIADSTMQRLTGQHGKTYCVGIVTNHTGKDQAGNRNIDALLNMGVAIKVIFTPQHGFFANKYDESETQETFDVPTSLPMISWHGNIPLRNAYLQTVDVVIFDLQDSGMRQSYSATLLDVLKTAADYGKQCVILDRPNLLGGFMEGGLGEMLTKTSLAAIPVPVRHGMTTGELAHYLNEYVLNKKADVRIVPMENYHRHAVLASAQCYGLSPNLTTAPACHGYSLLGLLGEVAPFDTGVGTDKAFQCLLLPDSMRFSREKWYKLRSILDEYGVESKFYRTFSKRKNEYCSGLALFVRDINNFSSFTTMLAVLGFFKQEGLKFSFSPHFDKVIGSTKVREFFQGSIGRKELEREVNTTLASFYDKAKGVFMYKPLPKIIKV